MSATGAVVWFTGLPRAGKTTLARAVHARLQAQGRSAVLLDGDEVRAALVPAPGYDEEGRAAFYATLARLSVLVASQGAVALVSATAHRRAFREAARASAPRFIEVYVGTQAEVCRARPGGEIYADPQAARELPGAGVAYEAPESPEVRASGGDDADALAAVLRLLEPLRTA